MNIVWSWLEELVDIEEAPEKVAERLTFAGFEVEAMTRLGDDFDVGAGLKQNPETLAE